MAQLQPGQFVSITQQIPHQRADWTTNVTGEIINIQQKKTGSWYAHAKDDKLWLDRLTLRKADGEIAVLILDQFTHIEQIAPPPTPPPEAESQVVDTVDQPADEPIEQAQEAESS